MPKSPPSRLNPEDKVVPLAERKSLQTLLRNPYERARNVRASAQRGGAWTIRDGVENPLVLGITREIPLEAYKPHLAFTTLDDPLILP